MKTTVNGRCAQRLAAIAGVVMIFMQSTLAQTEVALSSPNALKKMSLEELMDVEVTSVSKRPQKLTETASAIQLITQEDIRRSGATNLPQALRLATNLHVARIDSKSWAISARGFNNSIANKLLVMVDGRTIYTPLYSGVFWDVQHVLLEDIDRIEVISGPGGTLWGANAVNGVINIITKSAKETQGLLVTAGGGSLLRDFGAARYGGRVGENLYLRTYGQRLDHNTTPLVNGHNADNAWDMNQGGFRMEWLRSENSTLTVQGDVYGGTLQQLGPDSTFVDGQNLLSRWTHAFSAESDLQVQLYFDRTWREVPKSFSEELNTYDLDFQHRLTLGPRNTFIWGAGYRMMRDWVKSSPGLAFLPAEKNLQLASGFVQDEWTLLPDRLKLTLGTKVERNGYTGVEIQPSGRMAWTPTDHQTVWGAVSRAVRSPSRIDADFFAPRPPVPDTIRHFAGGPDFKSETVLSYELGYRVRPLDPLSLSLATFLNRYGDLRTIEYPSPYVIEFKNGLEGQSEGVELTGNFQAMEWWRLRGGYTFLHQDFWKKSGPDTGTVRGEGNDPRHQLSLSSTMDLPAHFQFDVTGRYVDSLPFPPVLNYSTFQVRLAWQFKSLELSVVGLNLWEKQHLEFGSGPRRQENPRSVYGKATWQY